MTSLIDIDVTFLGFNNFTSYKILNEACKETVSFLKLFCMLVVPGMVIHVQGSLVYIAS